MLIWEGSAVRVEEAFPDLEEQEELNHAQPTDADGFQKLIPNKSEETSERSLRHHLRSRRWWHSTKLDQRKIRLARTVKIFSRYQGVSRNGCLKALRGAGFL